MADHAARPYKDPPPGWGTEGRRRQVGIYQGRFDKFFYEPGTDKQFRSLKAAWNQYYKSKAKEQNGVTPQTTNLDSNSETSQRIEPAETDSINLGDNSKAKNISMKKLARNKATLHFDFANPPEKVSWMLTDAESDTWIPYIGGVAIPDMEGQEIAATFEFVTSIANGDQGTRRPAKEE